MRKLHLSILLGTASIIAITSAASAKDFDIPKGDLKGALDAYISQAGVPLVVMADAVKGIHTQGAKGDMAPDVALQRILRGTGFVAKHDTSGMIAVVPAPQEKHSRAELAVTQLAEATPQHAAANVETVVVTSSKIKGDIQTVPIAITALSQEQLTSRQIAGGPDLVKEVPNLTFSKTNFTGYNIEIRGIGTQAISVTTDPAVAVAFNDTPFIRNHFFEQEFYDVSQVEVLRGPQGTLYGRNATAGVVNVVSAVPTDHFEAMLSADWGNYTNRRYEGMVNLPIAGDKLALRIAGEWTKRDGYSFNSLTNKPIDGRDLWSSRATLRWRPVESVTADFIWEHFQESDDRLRSAKQLCDRDAAPGSVLGVSTSSTSQVAHVSESYLNQGCLPGSMYGTDAFGVPDSLMLPYYGGLINAGGAGGGVVGSPLNTGGIRDAYTGTTQSHNLRVIESILSPHYKANNDTLELNAEWDVAPSLTFNSATGYNRDFLWSTEDFNRFNTQPGIFLYDPSGKYWSVLTTPDGNNLCTDGYLAIGMTCSEADHGSFSKPTGIFCDPQLGCSNRLVGEDLSDEHAWQFSQELRLASNFKGPFNFSAGGNYMHYETEENYYVFFNTLTVYAATDGQEGRGNPARPWVPGVSYNTQCVTNGHELTNPNLITSPLACLGYIDPHPIGSLDNQGHNYFLSQNPYALNSYALFGEAYFQLAKDLKLTGGLRWTDDQKHFVEIPSEVLTLGYGYPSTGDVNQEWKKFTGRFVASWTPKLDFTDQSLFYGSYSHGYKAGGANPPGAVLLVYYKSDIINPAHPKTFKPEYNDAFEIGTKNTALDGALTFNGDIFYYDYKGYQISQIVDRTSINLNFDATVRGAEIQAMWEAAPGLKFGFAGGYEHTRIADGSKAVDLMDRTAGNPDWVLVKPFATQASNCVAPAYVVAYLLDQAHGISDVTNITSLCGEAYASGHDPVSGKPYTAWPTGKSVLYGKYPIDPSYPGFDPLAGTKDDPYTGQNTFDGVDYGPAPNGGTGFYKNVGGNELPNAPHFTASFTADYSMPVSANWAATLHGDFYWQSQSWARVFNDRPYDKIRGYSNANLALILNDAAGWQVMGYVKNVFDTTAITGTFLNSDDTGLTTNVFLTDPRLYGMRITKNFDAGDGGFDLFSGAGRPQIWLTLGGNYNAVLAAKSAAYNPDIIGPNNTVTMTQAMLEAGFPAPASYERSPDTGFDWEGNLTFEPEDTNWVLKAGIRYGRSGNNQRIYKSEIPGTRTRFHVIGAIYFGCTKAVDYNACHSGPHRKFINAHSKQSEQHTIMDFEAGVNVGIGLFGAKGEGTVAAGVREAEFESQAGYEINSVPFYVFTETEGYRELYENLNSERRSFHGIGPQIAWDANQTVLGNPEQGRVTVDWGVNAALLFGRQSANVQHHSSYCYINGETADRCRTGSSPYTQTKPHRRSRRVTVPNLGGYIGASVRYSNAKISLGYRADEFFNAMDGGQATAKKYDRGFYGPYLNLSIGFGG